MSVDQQQLSFDIRRTILLGAYIEAWGLPLTRVVSTKENLTVEVYFFPPSGELKVNRYATVGISSLARPDGKPIDWELFVVTPCIDAGASPGEIETFMLDVMAFSLRPDVPFDVGQVFDESPLVPKSWTARAFFLDEARAEPEFLSEICVGRDQVRLFWIVPIHKNEFELISTEGIEAFDKLANAAQWSTVDPQRDSYL
jgi:hypothetical protein